MDECLKRKPEESLHEDCWSRRRRAKHTHFPVACMDCGPAPGPTQSQCIYVMSNGDRMRDVMPAFGCNAAPSDTPLTDCGIAAAFAAGRGLQGAGIDIIVSAASLHCLQTAIKVSEGLGLVGQVTRLHTALTLKLRTQNSNSQTHNARHLPHPSRPLHTFFSPMIYTSKRRCGGGWGVGIEGAAHRDVLGRGQSTSAGGKMPVCSLTAASIACRSSKRAAVATAATIAAQNVAQSATCSRAERTSGGTSAAHATAVATAGDGAVSGRASTAFQRRSAHRSRAESASARKSPCSSQATCLWVRCKGLAAPF